MFKYKRPGLITELFQLDKEFVRIESAIQGIDKDIEVIYNEHKDQLGTYKPIANQDVFNPVANYPGRPMPAQGFLVRPGLTQYAGVYDNIITDINGVDINPDQFQLTYYAKPSNPINTGDTVHLSVTMQLYNVGYTTTNSPKLNVFLKNETPFDTVTTINRNEIEASPKTRIVHVNESFVQSGSTTTYNIYMRVRTSLVYTGNKHDPDAWKISKISYVITHQPKE